MVSNKSNIVIIGASGHAKVIIDIIERLEQYNIVGLIDSFKPKGSYIFDYQIIGKEDDIPNLGETYNFNTGIIAIGDNWTRKIIHEKIEKIDPNFAFISAIHPTAVIGKHVKIGIGTVIMAGVIVNSDAKIGDFCIINTKASFGHDGVLEKYASLAPNATIGGNVTIGKYSAICLSANVIQDVTIGKNSIIGAGSLINRNIGDYKMVYGVPGKIIKNIDKGEKYLYHVDGYVKQKLNHNHNRLEVITEKEAWDQKLEQIGDYDFYHTFDYHTLSKTVNNKPVLIVYKNNNVLIALPLIIRDISGTKYKDATSTYGYAGPIAKGVSADFDNTDFISNLQKFFNEKNIISVFSRLNPFIRNQNTVLQGFGDIACKGKVVNIDLSLNIETQRTKYRRRLKTHINKARRLCTVRKAKNDQEIQVFIDIYYQNMDRVHAKNLYYFDKNYFYSIVKSNAFKTDVLLAIDKDTDEIIAGSMFITTNNIVQYHLSGTKNSFLHAAPTKLLIDEMRLIASRNNSKFFNLGGGLGSKDDDSLFDFKSSFSKDFKTFSLWELIVNKAVYDNLVSERDIDEDSEFFPLYRYVKT